MESQRADAALVVPDNKNPPVSSQDPLPPPFYAPHATLDTAPGDAASNVASESRDNARVCNLILLYHLRRTAQECGVAADEFLTPERTARVCRASEEAARRGKWPEFYLTLVDAARVVWKKATWCSRGEFHLARIAQFSGDIESIFDLPACSVSEQLEALASAPAPAPAPPRPVSPVPRLAVRFSAARAPALGAARAHAHATLQAMPARARYVPFDAPRPHQHPPQPPPPVRRRLFGDAYAITDTVLAGDPRALCLLCATNPVNVSINPCNHPYMCRECALTGRDRGISKCAICNGRIESIIPYVGLAVELELELESAASEQQRQPPAAKKQRITIDLTCDAATELQK